MTKEEIKKRIDELEDDIFFLAMKDRWNKRDYELDTKWNNELKELKKELEKN